MSLQVTGDASIILLKNYKRTDKQDQNQDQNQDHLFRCIKMQTGMLNLPESATAQDFKAPIVGAPDAQGSHTGTWWR
jgi:hypothetical protein